MITAVDTSVLIAIDQDEESARTWLQLLIRCREEGALCICDVVAAEFFAVILDQNEFDVILADLGIEVAPTSTLAACLAGRTFREYRDLGGPREHFPDFLIAAHAQSDANRLISPDRGYLRRYFPSLTLLSL